MIIVVVGENRGREIGCGGDVPYNYDRTNKAKITNFLMLYMIQGVRDKNHFEQKRPKFILKELYRKINPQ